MWYINFFWLFFGVLFFVPVSANNELLMSEEIATINRIQYEHWLSLFSQECKCTDTLRFWRSDKPNELFNAVVDCRMNVTQAIEEIHSIQSDAKKNNYRVSWWITPFTKPDNLAELLQDYGFSVLVHCECMVKELSEPIEVVLPAGIEIKLVVDESQLKEFVHIGSVSSHYDEDMINTYYAALIERGISDPQVEYYIAYLYGEPVGTGLLLKMNEDITSFYSFSTLPWARNRGIGTAMMQFQLKRSRELGAKKLVLMAAPKAQNIMKQLGFEKSHDLYIYGYEF